MTTRKRPRRPVNLTEGEQEAILFALRYTMSNERLTNKMPYTVYQEGLRILGDLNAGTPLYKLGYSPMSEDRS